MDTQYKSSSYATYIQYIAAPIILGIFLFYAYSFLMGGNFTEEEYFFMPFWVWASIVVIINVIKLRYIKVRENNILIRTLRGEKVLEYKDIEWINQNIFGSNWYIISIKYKDSGTGKSKIIFIFPEQYTTKEGLSVLNPFNELNITKYIREQTIRLNSAYSIKNEPSRWYLAKWIFGSFLPFLIISFLLIL